MLTVQLGFRYASNLVTFKFNFNKKLFYKIHDKICLEYTFLASFAGTNKNCFQNVCQTLNQDNN